MIKTTLLLTSLTMCIGLNKSFAQDVKLATGGNAAGSNGSASYSVGQINYKVQGVQQPIEIYNVGNAKIIANSSINCTVFPNPTTHSVTLKRNSISSATYYQLLDATNKLITTDKLVTTETVITMQHYPNGVYYLNVIENNNVVKSFKLIKNN